jgi:SHS2 domain-containing protein
MPFEFLEDGVTSDVTFHAWGDTLDELFAAAVEATTAIMVAELDSVHPRTQRAVEVEADALDLLLLRLLEEVVFLKDTEGLLLRAADMHVAVDHGRPRARATLAGEPIDRQRHMLVADVKAVTLYGLRVERTEVLWEAQVTLDV